MRPKGALKHRTVERKLILLTSSASRVCEGNADAHSRDVDRHHRDDPTHVNRRHFRYDHHQRGFFETFDGEIGVAKDAEFELLRFVMAGCRAQNANSEYG